jgi:serine phosphatase RsbU (regulator of sigma subunit)
MIYPLTIESLYVATLANVVIDSEVAKYIFLSVLVLVVGFLVMSRQTRTLIRAKRLISEKDNALLQLATQREELTVKNKNLTDSIVYARKIQDSLIPSASFFEKHFKEAFVLFKPRDIVSGDFYFVCEKDSKVYVVAADCTGHGVPGALMSMIGLQALDRIIQEGVAVHPGEILNSLSCEVESIFNRDTDVSYPVRDGMELSICMVEEGKKKIEFSGSFLSLYLLREGNLIELKGDKSLIGAKEGVTNFTNHEIELQGDDTIYLFTDGYVDQFGGEDNKKFMHRRFRYLLVTIHKYSLSDQKTILIDNILSWMGSNEQVDDIMVLAFRP